MSHSSLQTVSKIKPPQYCLFFPPFMLIFLCFCQSCVITGVFLFHLGFHPFKLLFHTNVVPEEIHNCCVARHAIYLCYMATKYDPPIAFITDSRPERSVCKICCIYLPNLKCQVGGLYYIQIFQFVF